MPKPTVDLTLWHDEAQALCDAAERAIRDGTVENSPTLELAMLLLRAGLDNPSLIEVIATSKAARP